MKRLLLIALVLAFALSVTAAALPMTSGTAAPSSSSTLARLTTFEEAETVTPPECPLPVLPGC